MFQDVYQRTPDHIEEFVDAGYNMCHGCHNYCLHEIIFKLKGLHSDREYCDRVSLAEDAYAIHSKFALLSTKPKFLKTGTEEFLFENAKYPVKFTKNNLYSTRHVFGMDKNSIFFIQFRKILRRLFESGMIDQNSSKLKEHKKVYIPYERKKEEIILSWNYLYAGFYVWLGALLISSIVFVFELMYYAQLKKKTVT